MNAYDRLKEVIDYIENHLEDSIKEEEMSKILGVNPYMMHRLFSFLFDMSLSEYIRNRRLSNAGYDLYYGNKKIMDIALNYQYENATSFSRAFTKFHGIKPSQVKKQPNHLKIFPKLSIQTPNLGITPMEYNIVELEEMTLYGVGIKTNDDKISKDAPEFFQKMKSKYDNIYGPIDYGMVVYQSRFSSIEYEYWVLYKKEIKEFQKYKIPKGKWLRFKAPTDEAEDIQKISKQFYTEFVPSTKYKFKDLPELEYYHDGICEFLVPIED